MPELAEPRKNGVYDPAQAAADVEEIARTARPTRGPVDKRNHLSIVEIRHLLQLSNIPRGCWEAVTAIYNEYIQFRHAGMDSPVDDWPGFTNGLGATAGAPPADLPPDDGEWLVYQRDWINTLFLTSQSVDGRQSELMVRGMGADKAWESKHPASQVTGNSESGKPESKGAERRWFGRN